MLIDAEDIIAENDRHLRGSRWALENISLANKAIDVLRAAAYLPLTELDDITMLRLAVRLINAAGAGGQSALSGYYQQAASQIRDLIEVGFLLDLFRREPSSIAKWREADDKARRKSFSAFELRTRLNALDGTQENRRDEAYSFFSTHGTHVAPNTVALISPGNNTIIGPFPDRDRVVGLSFDLARYLAAAAGYLTSWLGQRSVAPDDFTRRFVEAVDAFDNELAAFSKRTTKAAG